MRLGGPEPSGKPARPSRPARDWENLGYHGTFWSSIKRGTARRFARRTPLRLLTGDKLKEWLPRTAGGYGSARRKQAFGRPFSATPRHPDPVVQATV
jgi:hypothetical protein